MSLITLYEEKKSAFGPPVVQDTYEQFIFDMEKNGTNDLVERNQVDPTFRPPLPEDTYTAQLFKEGAVSSRII
jgi:hypothetical protein